MNEFPLGNDVLLTLGIDLDKQIEQLATKANDNNDDIDQDTIPEMHSMWPWQYRQYTPWWMMHVNKVSRPSEEKTYKTYWSNMTFGAWLWGQVLQRRSDLWKSGSSQTPAHTSAKLKGIHQSNNHFSKDSIRNCWNSGGFMKTQKVDGHDLLSWSGNQTAIPTAKLPIINRSMQWLNPLQKLCLAS